MKRSAVLLSLSIASVYAAQVQFTARTIATGLRGGYQVTIVDINHDRKPDLLVVASGMDELIWFENPGWQRHVIARGFKGMINAAAYDTDGDGIPEVALAHGFANRADQSTGIVSILKHNGAPRELWTVREIDRLTTSHRLRWADIDGSRRKVLINAPLTGEKARPPDYRDHVPLVYYRPGDWKRQVAGDENEGVMHGIWIMDWDGRGRDSILTASFAGIDIYRFGPKGSWLREELAKGNPGERPKGGSSDIAVGRAGGKRFMAAIEPWHGNEVVVYRSRGTDWIREVIDSSLLDAHSIVVGDFDGDRNDELIVAQRGKPGRVLVYSQSNGAWEKTVLDEGEITAASCVVGDLNGDRRLDVVCVGSGTANLKWYQNESR